MPVIVTLILMLLLLLMLLLMLMLALTLTLLDPKTCETNSTLATDQQTKGKIANPIPDA